MEVTIDMASFQQARKRSRTLSPPLSVLSVASNHMREPQEPERRRKKKARVKVEVVLPKFKDIRDSWNTECALLAQLLTPLN